MRPDQAKDPIARFWEKVQKGDDCWLWTAGTDKDGYGKFRIGSMVDGTRRQIRAHVFAWTLVNGEVPEGLFVLHTCDTPGCVRESHLYVGTAQDNSTDMKVRKRTKKAQQTHCMRGHEFNIGNTITKPNGTRKCRECNNLRRRKPDAKFGNAKLEPKDVIEIRESLDVGTKRSLLASRYGVTVGAINHIAQGRTWAHL